MNQTRPAPEKQAAEMAAAEFKADINLSNPPSLPYIIAKVFKNLSPSEIIVLLDASDEDLLDDVMCTGFEIFFPTEAEAYLGPYIELDEADG